MNKKLNIPEQPELWVLLPVFLATIPHYPRLPAWMTFLIPLFFFWRLCAIYFPRLMPHKLLPGSIAVLAMAAILFHYGTILGKTAGSSLLCILLSIKLLECNKQRDYMLLIAISAFVIVTNFLFSQSIPTVTYMFLLVILLVTSLISLNRGDHNIALKTRFRLASSLVIYSLPIMIILFFLFPRIPGALWKLPDDKTASITGLSETMSPGNISQLIQSDAIAFRVKFNQDIPEQKYLYWRGFILWFFDGQEWSKGKTSINPSALIEAFSNKIDYTVTLEPHNKKWIFALDIPTRHDASIQFNGNYALHSKRNISSIYQYSLESHLDYRIGLHLSDWERIASLQLPVNSNHKTIQLGKQWKNKLHNPEKIINQALKTFNRENFIYTLNPPATPGFDPVDQFLFNTRKGFCEHYASSFTLLMRAAGIPARVVVGYQGGALNPVNNYLSIRQRDAHAWTEVWIQNKGWIRIDPTAAVAPERVELNLDAALNPDEVRPLYMQLDVGLIKQFKQYWDAIDNSWKQWIIAYNAEKQEAFLSTLFNQKINLYHIVLIMMISLSCITLLISLLMLRPVRRHPKDPAQKLYETFCKKMARKGLEKHRYEGPEDFSYRVKAMIPAQKDKIDFFIKLYINARYRSQQNKQQIEKMKQLVKGF